MAYSEKEKTKIIDKICKKIAKGDALRDVIEGISTATFYSWIDNDEEKLKQYTGAREERNDKIFEDILNIADDKTKDFDVHKARLRIDARKWMLGKLNSQKYGDKIQQDIVLNDKRKEIGDLFPSEEEINEK